MCLAVECEHVMLDVVWSPVLSLKKFFYLRQHLLQPQATPGYVYFPNLDFLVGLSLCLIG